MSNEEQSVSDSSEVIITANLVFEKEIVSTVQKTLGFQEESIELQDQESNEESITATIDEIVTQFFEQIMQSADEMGFQISNEEIVKITANCIIFIIKQSEKEIVFDVHVDKKTESEENPEQKEEEGKKEDADDK